MIDSAMKTTSSMFRPATRLLIICAGLLLAASIGQGGTSRPVGYVIQSVPAGQTRSFSVPLDAPASNLANSVGLLTGVGAGYLENTNANWVVGAFSTTEAPYFVRLASGPSAGRLFRIVNPENTATRLYVASDGIDIESLGITAGTQYEIIPADTLSSLFGTSSSGSPLLQGANDPLQADLVQVWGGASWINFYYNTDWGRWARDRDFQPSPSRDNFLLRPDRGIMITRRANTDLNLAILGRVLVQPPQAYHSRNANALTFLATMQAMDTTLGDLALQSNDRTHNWLGGSDADQADLLLVWAGASWFSFYYNTDNNQWERVDEAGISRNDYVIKAGTPVFVQRREAGETVQDVTIEFPAIGG